MQTKNTKTQNINSCAQIHSHAMAGKDPFTHMQIVAW